MFSALYAVYNFRLFLFSFGGWGCSTKKYVITIQQNTSSGKPAYSLDLVKTLHELTLSAFRHGQLSEKLPAAVVQVGGENECALGG